MDDDATAMTHSRDDLVDAGEPLLTSTGIDLAMAELKFHHDRIAAGSDLVSTIGQFIFVIFGAIVVAALKVPEVIIVLPLFWTAWLFHAQQREADTAKHAVLARRLETQLNRAVGGKPVAIWNSTLTTGANRNTAPLVSIVNFAYWGVLFAGSWVASVVVYFKIHHPGFAVAAIAASSVISIFALLGFGLAPRFARRCRDVVVTYTRTWPTGTNDRAPRGSAGG